MAGNWRHLYGSKQWRSLRAQVLVEEPICQMPGCNDLSTVADHIKPHKGDESLFFDRRNVQGICAPCHNGDKQQREKSGTVRGADRFGNPLDPLHSWNR